MVIAPRNFFDQQRVGDFIIMPTEVRKAPLLDYQKVRGTTDRLSAPLGPEDQVVQSMDDVSPTKWHRAHVTWFFETFLLRPHLPGYTEFDPVFGYLYNSYYESVGERHARNERGVVTRPTIDDVAAYRAHVDKHMRELIQTQLPGNDELAYLVQLGLHHEQQHQELLLMDIKHVFSRTLLHPAYHDRGESPCSDEATTPMAFVAFDGGLTEIGHVGKPELLDGGFAFDNEGPRHRVFLEPYALADRLITCGEYLAFMDAGGYQHVEHWLSAGWEHRASTGWDAPMYWESQDDQWMIHTLSGLRPLQANEPVTHLSYYEADAYARWADARLPTEFEWEAAAAANAGDPEAAANIATDGAPFHPRPAANPSGQLRQTFGDVWEWTSSSYGPYPGFQAAAGAVGEYNGKFMVNQYVLRGGCAATPPGHIRATYRNFFPAHSRWMFSGLRLARTP